MLWLFYVDALEWLKISSVADIAASKLDVVGPINGIDALHLVSHSFQSVGSLCGLLRRGLCCHGTRSPLHLRGALAQPYITGCPRRIIQFLLELAPLPDVQALHLLVELIYLIFHLILCLQALLRGQGFLPSWSLKRLEVGAVHLMF